MSEPTVALVELGSYRSELNEPLGILTIASVLQQDHGLREDRVALYWEAAGIALPDPLPSSIKLLGISAQIGSLDRLKALYHTISDRYPDLVMVVGNLLGIYADHELLRLMPRLIVCTGEGEVAFSRIYDLVKRKVNAELPQGLRLVPSIAFMFDGDVVRTPRLLADLVAIPPPRRDFVPALVRLGGITRIEGSRGCHWGKCEFCSVSSRFGIGSIRRFPHERVLADLAALADLGARHPYFSDEDFFGRQYQASIQLAKLIVEQKACGRLPKDLSFFVSVLASDVRHPEGREALRWWRTAGLREVFVGVEAGNAGEVRRFQKKANVATNTGAIESLLAMGFQVDIGFIMFEPMIDFEELKRNVEWLMEQSLGDVDSRVTKALRVQPQTASVDRYRELLMGPLDVNELQYPYQYRDVRVAALESAFRAFELPTKADVYALLASARGEVLEDGRRQAVKRRLALLRDIDLLVLRMLIDATETGSIGDLGQLDLSEQLQLKRHLLDTSDMSLGKRL